MNKIILFFIPFFLFAKGFFAQINKDIIYQDEPFEVIFSLQLPKNAQIQKIEFEPKQTKNFAMQKIAQKNFVKNNLQITNYYYLFIPRVYGNIIFPSFTIKVLVQDKKLGISFWKFYYSKEQTLHILKHPKNFFILGNLLLKRVLDKNKTAPNEAIHYTLKLKGLANFHDLTPFSLNLKDAFVISNKPKISYQLKNDTIVGTFTQHFLIVPQKSFILPKVTFSYFNTKIQASETLLIKQTPIKVITPTNFKELAKIALAFVLGILVAFFFFKRKKNKTTLPLKEQIKKAKNDKELLQILISLPNNNIFQDIIIKLEDNIYKSKKYKIQKKEILKRLE